MKRGKYGSEYSLAKLPGMRLVTFDETESGESLNESLLKNLTGCDVVAARNPAGRPFYFKPQCKVWITGNHKPKVTGTDTGLWRRFKIIPCNQRISDAERDPKFDERLKQEVSGILNWAVEGAVRWYKNGLSEPEAVQDAVNAHRQDMDVLGQFIVDCIIQTEEKDDRVRSQDVYDSYTYWCSRTGHKPYSMTDFKIKLEEKGLVFKHRRDGNFWLGISIRSVEELDDVYTH